MPSTLTFTMPEYDYLLSTAAVVNRVRRMVAAGSLPDIEWFDKQHDAARVAENGRLYEYALTIGYDLAARYDLAQQTPTPATTDQAAPAAAPVTVSGFAHRNAADMDWSNIPCTPWLHGQRLVRGYVTVLTGLGGIGKTALGTAVAVSLALGRNLVDPTNQDPRWRLHEAAPCKVYLYNLEDDYTESMRRVKALLNHHKIDVSDLGRNLEMGDGTVTRLIVAIADKKTGLIQRQQCVEDLIAWLIAEHIDVLDIDPLVKAHKCVENDNDHMDEVMIIFKYIAVMANCAIWLKHHSGKSGTTLDSTGSRGATAIIGAARVAETMSKPTAEEKTKFGLDGSFVRLDGTKANMSAANEHTMWLRLDGVAVGNPSSTFPMGDYRQVVTLIQPQGQTERMERGLFDAICAELRKVDPAKRVWAKAKQNKGVEWIGKPFMAAGCSEAETKLLIKEWIANHLLTELEHRNQDERRTFWGLRLNELAAGKWPGFA